MHARHARCLVDAQGAILACSAAGTRFFKYAASLKVSGGRLTLQDPDAQRRLQAALRSNRRQMIFADGQDHPRPAILLIEPIAGAACITLWRPARPQLRLFMPLVERFRLSPAQARVAAELIAGRSLLEIARKLGISIETVRSHLKAIFDKTGTRTQSGLVALYLRFTCL
jgi:DNA-binding CsgD family transcriptional regulator